MTKVHFKEEKNLTQGITIISSDFTLLMNITCFFFFSYCLYFFSFLLSSFSSTAVNSVAVLLLFYISWNVIMIHIPTSTIAPYE